MEYAVELNAEIIGVIFEECLVKDDERVEGAVEVEGIMGKVSFKPDLLNSKKAFIEALLRELPDPFQAAMGGSGWSFLNACDDRHGNQWTGFQLRMDQLFMLGMAVGKVECLAPRQMWSMLPGGMPYYIVK